MSFSLRFLCDFGSLRYKFLYLLSLSLSWIIESIWILIIWCCHYNFQKSFLFRLSIIKLDRIIISSNIVTVMDNDMNSELSFLMTSTGGACRAGAVFYNQPAISGEVCSQSCYQLFSLRRYPVKYYPCQQTLRCDWIWMLLIQRMLFS